MYRHPSEYFVKFLMSQQRPEALDNGWITYSVDSLMLPRPDPAYLQYLRSWFGPRIPADFKPYDRFHRESVKFMRGEGIYSLHNPDEATRNASGILTNLRAREVVESLLLGHIDSKEIAKKVNSRFSEFHTAETIEAYKHYYWNVDLLKPEEWPEMFNRSQYSAMSKTLSILDVGPAMALHVTGFQQQIESKVVLREMMDALYFDFRTWQKQPMSERRTKALATLARSACVVDESLSNADSALRESLKQFEKFRMRHADAQVPGIKDVAPDGNFTNSGARLLEAAEPDPKNN